MKRKGAIWLAVLFAAAALAGCASGSTSTGSTADDAQKGLVKVTESGTESVSSGTEGTETASEAESEASPEADMSTASEAESDTGDSEEPVMSLTDGDTTDSSFDVTEKLYASYYGTTIDFLIITNHSSENVSVAGSGTAKSADGTSLGVAEMSIDVIAPEETGFGYLYYYDTEGVDHVELDLQYRKEDRYLPVLSNLSVNEIRHTSSITVQVTNNGSYSAQFLEAYGLFFDADGNIIDYDSVYLTDAHNELKPGATLAEDLRCYESFDHAEVYFCGNNDGDLPNDDTVSPDKFEVTEHILEFGYGTSVDALVIKSNAEESVAISGNGVALNANGDIIAASSCHLEVLGPGETYVVPFYFETEETIDHVEYTMHYVSGSVYYESMSSSLSSEVTVNQSNIIVKVTNNGTEAVKYPEVYVLFFDADGNFINQGTTYAADDEGELKPGASKDVQLYTPSGYASHQIYLRGYK